MTQDKNEQMANKYIETTDDISLKGIKGNN
jgi:hypothetical protein